MAEFDPDSVPGWFDFAEIYDQAIAEAEDGDTLVEVGCWMGRSLIYLAQRARESGKRLRIVAVDRWEPWGHPVLDPVVESGDVYGEFRANLERAGMADLVEVIRAPSLEAATRFADGSVRFVFLDDDHSLEAVRAGIRAWLPKVSPGGVLAGHDYDRRSSVRRAVLERFGERAVERLPRSWLVRVQEPPAARGGPAPDAICLALNVKDEAPVIARCIESAAPWVDGVVCADTGSTDDTIAEVREACDRLGLPLTLHERPWENFAASQTALLREAREVGYAYGWVIDADETIRQTAPIGPGPLRFAEGLDGFDVCRLYGGDWEVWTTRIFRLDRPWRYEGERHAAPTLADARVRRLGALEIANHRDGMHGTQAAEEQRARFRRDVVHFLSKLTESDDDRMSRDWYYLAQSAHDAGQREIAEWAYRERLKVAGGFEEERYIAALQVARYTGDIRDYQRAIDLRPGRNEAWVEAARCMRLAGDPERASLLAAGAHIRPANGDRFLVQRSAYTWRTAMEIELARWDQGQTDAIERLAELYEQHPNEELWREFERVRTEAAQGKLTPTSPQETCR
jgi:glycosyltransferase involved in cell wall biosynthesis